MKFRMFCCALLVLLIGTGSVIAQELDLSFTMPTSMMTPGSPFSLDLTILNTGSAKQDSLLFVALTIGTGDYWFFPSWALYPPNIDAAQIDIASNSTDTLPIIPEMAWPAGAGEFSGALFLGAVIHNDVLISNVSQISFGWTEMPKTYEQISLNRNWVDGMMTADSQTAGFYFNGTPGSTYYIWWDELSSGNETSTADIHVSAFQQDKTTAYFRDVDHGFIAPQSVVIAPGETSVFVAVVADHGSEGSFKVGVTFFPFSPDKSVNARQAAAWMTGDFDSYNQSQQHPSYYNITLRMKRIWPTRTDGYWLYVEQAVSGSNPYRQRVYRVGMIDETRVGSDVCEFLNTTDMQNAVGAWALDDPLSDLTPDDFDLREGCTVFLTRTDADTFLGGTEGKECASDLNGATYATSEATLTADQMRSWDRGYNAADEQVWGAVAGPYIFDKKQNFDSDLDL